MRLLWIKFLSGYTKNNKPYINLILTIRNDVNNPVKGGKLFAALYKKKEPNSRLICLLMAILLRRFKHGAKLQILKMDATLNPSKQFAMHCKVRLFVCR